MSDLQKKRQQSYDKILNKMNTDKYVSGRRARFAIKKAFLTGSQRNALFKLATEKYGRGGKGSEGGKGEPATKRPAGGLKTRKKRNGQGDVNGSGESRVVTLVRLLMKEDVRDDLLRVLGKSMDAHLTLPELHEEISELSQVIMA